ncbi:MAG: flagellar basal body L-ring protein FlgH [Planctomycetes bacterium]|nr:flagellar basal body L-ring protein FlgH [Planctomycetota bacterium]
MNRIARILAVLVGLTASTAAQSLWDQSLSLRPCFSDTSARSVGDILTIVIDEQATIANKEDSNFEKESSLEALLTNFDIFPTAFEPLPHVAGEAQKSFDGTSKYDKDNRFESTMSVVVIDTLPNGNMIVEGTRSLMMDGETKVIKLTGLVRAFDVTRNNTVTSSQVANARISYQGTGPLSRATNRGWFSNLLDIVWPF